MTNLRLDPDAGLALTRPDASIRGLEMMSYLPPYYYRSKVMAELLNVEGYEFDLIRKALSSILDQFFVNTADWGLDLWEDELAIKRDVSLTDDQRRQRIIAKLRGFGTATPYKVIQFAEWLVGGGLVRIYEDFANYTVHIQFQTEALSMRILDVLGALRDILPAHLVMVTEFICPTWDAVDALNQSWDTWDAMNVSWDGLCDENLNWQVLITNPAVTGDAVSAGSSVVTATMRVTRTLVASSRGATVVTAGNLVRIRGLVATVAGHSTVNASMTTTPPSADGTGTRLAD